MRDRLIELISQSDKAFADKYTGKIMSHIDELYEFVADYLLKMVLLYRLARLGIRYG